MAYSCTITQNNENELSVQILTEAAGSIAACSEDMLLVAEAITQSCSMMIDSKENAYVDLLLNRADSLKTLAALYKTRSMRFENAAQKLVKGNQENVVYLKELTINN